MTTEVLDMPDVTELLEGLARLRMHMSGCLCLALCLIGLAHLAQADFVPDDELVSDPASDLIQPEFDAITQRIIWQDQINRLWIAHIDPITGDMTPINGRGQQLDSGLSPLGTVGNTPRYTWGFSGTQSAIVYNKDVDGIRTLSKAVEVAPDTWQTSLLENGDNRWKANGTPKEATDAPRIVYNRETPEGNTVTSWRILDDPSSEQSVVGIQGGRFLGSEPSIIEMAADSQRVVQIWNVPFSTGIPEQVSFGQSNKYNVYPFWAPEYHDHILAAMVNWKQLVLYRRINGVWTNFYQHKIPSGYPLLSSPEGFVVNGKSYVAIVSCDELGAGGFVGQPVGPSEIWVAGIDPDKPFFRRIDDPSYAAQRSEPEPVNLQNGPVVFYTELSNDNGARLLKRARTGTEDLTGYDVASYGGAWSSALRDNKNCACTPYDVSVSYTGAGEVAQSNTQIMHASLGPENQLYYTFSVSLPNGTETFLAAIDTKTMTESYRIDHNLATSKLTATQALVDHDGDYYVPANAAVNKFDATGNRLWQTPTHGLARAAQFTPDGNILFFTWNGWAYVVSPAGQVLLETNLTAGRTYPANPSCLKSGPLSSDCAYVGPPAVDPYSNRVYVTQLRKRGDSVLQAFQYQATPTVSLQPISPSPVLPGISTSPVLSADYSRIYVQDGGGNLLAYNTSNAQRIWSFPLGFVSDQPPVVTDAGFLMPGGTVNQDSHHNFIGIVQDQGTTAAWALQNSAYSPKSYAAAGAANRFVVTAKETATGLLKLLVVDPAGIVSATPWSGTVPNSLRGITLRDDGWVFVQTGGTSSVHAFRPAP